MDLCCPGSCGGPSLLSRHRSCREAGAEWVEAGVLLPHKQQKQALCLVRVLSTAAQRAAVKIIILLGLFSWRGRGW